MFIVLAALRRPYTVLVLVTAIAVASFVTMRAAPVDILPALGVPIVYVVQPYAGMSPTQIEGQLVNYYEYHFLYVAGIEHVESQSIQGMGLIRLYFHPGTNIAEAMAQVTAMAFRASAFMPAGTLPPFMVRYDAGSIPIAQLVFSSETRSESEVQDVALNQIRPMLATLPGVSAPPPSGGKVRTIVGYLDPQRMRAYGVSPDDVTAALARANVVLPAGNIRVGDRTLIAETNALVGKPQELERVPLRVEDGRTVYVGDVARVVDDADIVYNVALVNGRRTVYMPVTKRADASTLDVLGHVENALPRMRDALPEGVSVALEFDQSVHVRSAIRSLVAEGALGALLTGLVVLLFLRSWRSALIVTATIPISVLAALVALRAVGQTVNVMTLGGLALAVGILVDEATVAIENIHVHTSRTADVRQAVVDAMREVITPRLLAMVCILAVFIPAFFMVGIGASLFPPLALAVGFAMVASYVVSSTLVPVLAIWLHREHRAVRHEGRTSRRYGQVVSWTVQHKTLTLTIYATVLLFGLALVLVPGTELFPRGDSGELQLRLRAPPGTSLGRMTEITRAVDTLVRDEAGEGHVGMTLANIGNPAWSFPVNAVYVFNAGPHEATLLVSLTGAKRPRARAFEERLRQRIHEAMPELALSFEAGDVVSRIMSLGAPTPVQVTVAGKSLPDTRRYAEAIRDALAGSASLRDVQIPQALDYPTMHIEVDRERAAMQGLTLQSIGRSVVSATSSSMLTTPLFWTDRATGTPYRVALRVPEMQLRDADDVLALPVGRREGETTIVGQVAAVTNIMTPGEIDRLDNQRMVTVTANIAGDDLGTAGRDVHQALATLPRPPKGVRVAVHGQLEQMELAFAAMRSGLGLTVIVVLLVLIAGFQSLRDAVAVVVTTPAVFAGSAAALALSGTTWNVQSLMGTIMCIGVAIANAVLLVSAARDHRAVDRLSAVTDAARRRSRPIVMTSMAMVAGMLPMALALGGSGESASLARAVVGGLLAATAATLLVLPAVYATIASTKTASASLLPEARRGETS